MTFNIKVFTLFPSFFDLLKESLIGKALEKNIWNLDIINIRDYSQNKHKTVDDTHYGGGAGMIMTPEAISIAIDKNCDVNKTKFYYMSPRGQIFKQEKVKEIIENKDIAIICARYEGLDQRVIDDYNMEEISIGDYVLMGGEIPALAVIEACVRCLGGVVGDKDSLSEDSFGGIEDSKFKYLLEYPLYTKPEIWRNRKVPDVLISGHHKKINEWKIKEAEKITKERRPDL